MPTWLLITLTALFLAYAAGVLFSLAVDVAAWLIGLPQKMTGKDRVRMAFLWPLVVLFGE